MSPLLQTDQESYDILTEIAEELEDDCEDVRVAILAGAHALSAFIRLAQDLERA